jgi:hypothetical protein
MERNIVIAAACAVLGCVAGCYTPNEDRCSMINIPTEDPYLYPVEYPVINMGHPNLHFGHMHFSGIPTK